MSETIWLTIGHSPDPDDVFMWWPLGDREREPEIDTGRFRFEPVPEDIQTLNRRAIEIGDLDITAVSMHTYAHIAGLYAITAAGASMGDGYGPRLVCSVDKVIKAEEVTREDLVFAIPGRQTSAALALQMMLGRTPKMIERRFDLIPEAVKAGEAQVGVVIHQSQITYEEEGLALIADLGEWWTGVTGLPLPLGANVVKRDLEARFGESTLEEVSAILTASVKHAMTERETSLDYAAVYEPDLPRETAGRFVDMYVNDLTLDAGERGQMAVQAFLKQGSGLGLCPDPGDVRLVSPGKGVSPRG
ncbi:MAG: MqnA/MqnD/SBP family protein [Planctomycetota bacterium]